MTIQLQENVPLAPYTTIGIGGPARYFVRTTDVDELRAAVDWGHAHGQPIFILGGGSNLLIADGGFPGLVIHNRKLGMTVESEDEFATVKVAAGERWDDFVAFAVKRGWAGVECLSGIPGSTGATPIQNVGAYGQEVSETIIRVEVLDRRDGLVKTLTNWECRFAYRSSLFKDYERDRYVVVNVTFRLKIGGQAAIRYPELQKYVEERGITARDLMGVRGAVIAIRKRKGMVLDPADPDTRSDGSFFTNPVLDRSDFERFLRRARQVTGDGSIPSFPAGDAVKLSAAWLIEHAGFQKGFAIGKAGLSTKHTLAVVNRGGATAADVVALVETIQSKVRDVFGVELRPEPNFIGF